MGTNIHQNQLDNVITWMDWVDVFLDIQEGRDSIMHHPFISITAGSGGMQTNSQAEIKPYLGMNRWPHMTTEDRL